MDCQFLMMAITYVHYATFVATPDHSLPVGSVINARTTHLPRAAAVA